MRRTRVFLSHSSRDRQLARQIHAYLVSLGVEVWYDEYEIKVGDSITSKIEQGLTDCEFVLVLVTRNSVSSGWVEREWKSKYWDEVERNQVSVLPLLADDCALPTLLKDKKYADLRGSFAEGMNQLKQALGFEAGPVVDRTAEEQCKVALELMHRDSSLSRGEREWSLGRKIAAINAMCYPQPVTSESSKDDYFDWSGLCDRIFQIATSSFGRIVIQGPEGCGKTSMLNTLAARLGDASICALVWRGPYDHEEGGSYYFSHQVLSRLCAENMLGAATSSIRAILRKGASAGGLWYSGTEKGTRFLDAIMDRLRKETQQIPCVILVHDIDSAYKDHPWDQCEVCHEFLGISRGSYVVTSKTNPGSWLGNCVEHQFCIPQINVDQLRGLIKKRLSGLRFDYSGIVSLEDTVCETLIKSCGANLRRVFEVFRTCLGDYGEISVRSLRSAGY